MRTRARSDSGETLIEVLISLVIVGVVVGAFFSAIATTSTASTANKDAVSADAVLRDYAESAKQAVRDTCPSAGTGAPFNVSYTPPSGFAVTATGRTCPSTTTGPGVSQVDITATTPNGAHKLLSIEVRTP